jgi:CubicO group peptidase (beta-lactamase class C family)
LLLPIDDDDDCHGRAAGRRRERLQPRWTPQFQAQMRKHGLPGVALAVVEDGEIVYLQGYGTAGRGRP